MRANGQTIQALDSDVGKYPVKRPWHLGEIERLDEQPRVADLPLAGAAHETPKLLLWRPSLPRRLLLQGAERTEFTLSVDDPFHRGDTERADQLILQVGDAHVEAESLHVGAT